VHKKVHLGKGYVYAETRPEDCPICHYGMKVWRLWENSRYGPGEEWATYWEGRENERKTFEQFVENYEFECTRIDEKRFHGMEEFPPEFCWEERSPRQSDMSGVEI
jgi:hypothetical protein